MEITNAETAARYIREYRADAATGRYPSNCERAFRFAAEAQEGIVRSYWAKRHPEAAAHHAQAAALLRQAQAEETRETCDDCGRTAPLTRLGDAHAGQDLCPGCYATARQYVDAQGERI